MFERRCKGGRPTDNRTRLPQEKMVGGGFTIALAIHSLDSTLQNSIALPVRSVDLAKLPLQKRRFNQIILMWGKGFLSGNTRHCTGFTIALPIQSLDPLECRRGEASCSIDISLRRSETIVRRIAFPKPLRFSIALIIHSVDPTAHFPNHMI